MRAGDWAQELVADTALHLDGSTLPICHPLILPPGPPFPCGLQQFLLAELGTSGSLDGTQRLIVKGRFLPKAFETVLRR